MKLSIVSSSSSFKVLGDNTNLSNAWEQYFKRFEYYLKATGATKDEQQRFCFYT
jgi:hypothetical protein